MKKILELKKKLKALKAEGTELLTVIGDSDATEEQFAKVKEIEASVRETESAIETEEQLAEARRVMSPAGANDVNEPNPELTHGFKNLGEFCHAVRSAGQGVLVDDRLRHVSTTPAQQGGGAHGEGFTLPPQFRDRIIEVVTRFDEFGPLIDEEPTSSRSTKIGADESTPWGADGVQAYWKAEGAKMTASQMDTDEREVPLHQLYCLVTATEELVEDSPRFESRMTNKAGQKIAWKKNLSIVEGSGVGQPLGWMNSKALITVDKETGQSAQSIDPKNISKMFSRLLMVPGDKPFWLTNTTTFPELMDLKLGDRPIWLPSGSLAEAPHGFLLGYPVRFSEMAETLGKKGDLQLVSPKGFYGARHSAGPAFASSIHLYFDQGKEAYRWMFRYGGQPHLSKAVAPAKGTVTKSHFVTLAARQ